MNLGGIRAAFTENQAHTHPEHPDPRLRGRTYAIPFAQVWAAAVDMAGGGLRSWVTLLSDENLGILQADCRVPLLGSVDKIEIRMSLDENGQTRVDLSSISGTERGDFGRNSRRIRRFFRVLDKRTGAGPGKILDPTVPLIRTSLLAIFILAACGPGEEAATGTDVPETDSLELSRNFQGRSYERHIVFLTFQGDSTLLVPWSFSARTEPDGVDREVRGWLARSDEWDPFLYDRWEAPPSSAPWRILPHGPVRLIVGLEDALETILFEDGGRNLEVNLGELLVEWSGQRAQTFRIHEGTVVLADRTVEGHVLDMTRAWAAGDNPPGDWGVLLSGDSLQVVFENLDQESGQEGGDYSLRARIEFLTRQWEGVRLTWSEVRAFEPARRDVPMGWEVQSPEGDLEGSLVAVTPFFEAAEGEGPMLPVDALFEVMGTLTLGGAELPVRGLIRHSQR
ncbi:MAG: DUF1499 domain-containing protein [Gemmatimonadetes bacterium]|nr:DUF1499 domain-containing protein [Gemmatimonadota bacterium]